MQLRQYGDLTALVGDWNVKNLASKLFLTSLFCFLLDFGGDEKLDFGFPTNLTASATWWPGLV